ncbi:guanine nucleotide exchange factor for Rab-3A-like [Haliotis cracherodii]|uniref:guanine nucleotide exchange factor for Rab-3A-like n=1 Tax=Haliotis cracherodii TaxID=6455 RepID=UPI0039E8A187
MSGDAQLLVSDRPVSPQTSSPASKLPAAAALTQREPCVGQEANYRQPSSVSSSQSGSQGPTTPGTSDTEWGTRPPPQGAPSQLVDQTSAMAAVVVGSMAAAAVGLGTGTKSGDSPRVASGQAGQAPAGQRSQGSNSVSVTRSVSLTGAINGLDGTVPDEKQKGTIDESECPVVELRRHPARSHLRHAHSEAETTDLQISRRRSQTMAEMKEHAYHRLQEELQKAQTDLRLRDEECEKLSKVRDQMEEELDDLTASLFEEANKMVQEANVKRMHTEKLLAESNQKIEVLQAEVVALKQLVLTSTPSSPNKHLHPQIAEAKEKKVSKPFWKTHRRSTSHHEFTKESRQAAEAQQNHGAIHCKDFDTACYDQFLGWRQDPVMECTSPFLARMMMEDIIPCLNFSNKKLAERVQHCVEHNTLTIEPIPGDNSYPRKCSLTETNKLCNYKIKLEEDQEWYSISQMCRNRIASVCDFYTYIRYIHQGLVRQEDKDTFLEITRLRRQMALSRLGLL